MAIALATKTTASADFGGGSGNLSVNPPSGLAAGDLWIIGAICDSDGTGKVGVPTGFTAVTASVNGYETWPEIRAFWKIAGASESAVNVPMATGSYYCWASSSRWTGAHASAPIGASATGTSGSSTANALDAPDITTTVNDAYAYLLFGAEGDDGSGTYTINNPSGTTMIDSLGAAATYFPAAGAAYESRPTAGSYTPGNWSQSAHSDGDVFDGVGITFEIKPAAGGITLTPGVGAIAVAGLAPAVVRTAHHFPKPGVGAIAVAGLAPTVSTTAHHFPAPGVGAVVFAGLAPTVSISENQTVQPGVGAITVSGLAPAVVQTANHFPAPGAGSIVFTGLAPTVEQTAHHTITPGVGAVTITGLAPTVLTGDNQVVQPGVGAITFAGLAPTVSVTEHHTVAPGAGGIVIAGLAPTVVVTAHHFVSPGVGAVVFNGLAPDVQVTDGGTVFPGVGAIVITGLAPTVVQTAHHTLQPGVGTITLVGLMPTVNVSGQDSDIPQGGAGYPVYWQGRRRKRTLKEQPRKHLEQILESVVAEYYADLTESDLPASVKAKAAKLVKPYAKRPSKRQGVPTAQSVNWKALEADAENARQLMELWKQEIMERDLQAEDDYLMMVD